MSLEESRLEVYGLAAAGLVKGLAVEGWIWAKEIAEKRRHSAPEAGRAALHAVETSALEAGSNVVYRDFSPAKKPPIAA